jgi:nucleoid-associated protein YgaU
MGTTTQHPRPWRLPLPQPNIFASPFKSDADPGPAAREQEQYEVGENRQGHAEHDAHHNPEQAPPARAASASSAAEHDYPDSSPKRSRFRSSVLLIAPSSRSSPGDYSSPRSIYPLSVAVGLPGTGLGQA